MARKEPFKRISVADRIYVALNKRRVADFEGEFRPLPMNAYAERILWEYANGRLIRAGSAQAGYGEGALPSSQGDVTGAGGMWQVHDQSAGESHKVPKRHRDAHK